MNYSIWDESQKDNADKYIKHLTDNGFTLYCALDEKTLNPITTIYQINGHKPQAITLNGIAKTLNRPADKIHLFTEEDFKQCVKESEWEWMHYDSFTHIDFTNHPISTKSFIALMQQHGKEVESLVLGFKFNTCISPDELMQAEFNLAEQLNSAILHRIVLMNEYCSGQEIGALLEGATELEEIVLRDISTLHELKLAPDSLRKLKTISIDRCPIPDRDLRRLRDQIPRDAQMMVDDKPFSIDAASLTPASSSDSSRPLAGFEAKYNRSHPDSIDADTYDYPNKTFHIQQRFIGKFHSPHPAKIRLQACRDFSLNAQSQGAANPFLLIKAEGPKDVRLSVAPSPTPLYESFVQSGEDMYWGCFDLTLSNSWQAIPSLWAHETLQSYYLSENIPVELVKSEADGFYWIRALSETPVTARMEVLLQKPPSLYTKEDLAPAVRALMSEVNNYSNCALQNVSKNASAKEYLDAILAQKTGACRHRAIAFKELMSGKSRVN